MADGLDAASADLSSAPPSVPAPSSSSPPSAPSSSQPASSSSANTNNSANNNSNNNGASANGRRRGAPGGARGGRGRGRGRGGAAGSRRRNDNGTNGGPGNSGNVNGGNANGRGNNNSGSSGAAGSGAVAQALPEFTQGRKVLAVAASSPVKQVAGSIAHTSREGEPPVLSAVGPASVNQAVKAVAIARSYLEADGMDLVVEVSRGNTGGEIKDLILLNLKKTPRGAKPPADSFQNLKSAGTSSTSQLAGAIANNVRESVNVKITAVGQNPVFRAVDGICYGRRFLENDGIDLDFQPEFTHVQFTNGTEANAMQFVVRPHMRGASSAAQQQPPAQQPAPAQAQSPAAAADGNE